MDMEIYDPEIFDESKLFTAANADELGPDDVVIVADNLKSIKDQLEDVQGYKTTLVGINPEHFAHRFKDADDAWALAYLIEKAVPKKKYRPFRTSHELIEKWERMYPQCKQRPSFTMPAIWIRRKENHAEIRLINRFGYMPDGDDEYPGVGVDDYDLPFKELLDDWEFLDGGTCGIKLS